MKSGLFKRTLAFLLCAALLLYLPVVSSNAETEEESWTLIGQYGGTTKALALDGDTLYLGSGMHVTVLDVSDPLAMSQLGTSPLLPQFVETITSDGNGLLYVGCGDGGLVILDVSDPSAPRQIGALDTLGYTEGITLYGDYAVLADGPCGLQIVDVSDPTDPAVVSEAYPLAYAYDVVIQDDVAYIAGGGSGLLVVDLSDPEQPVEAGLISVDGFQYDAELANGRLYLAGAWGGVNVFSLDEPLTPTLLSGVTLSGWAMSLSAYGNNLLVMDGADGAMLLGISGSRPMLMSELSLGGFMLDGELDGTRAFVLGREKGLVSLDYSLKFSPTILSRWMPLLDGRRITASDGVCYVAGGLSGLHVLDVDNAEALVETYWYDTDGGYANSVLLREGTLYVGSHLSSADPLMIFDTSDPLHPEKTGAMKSDESVFNSAVRALTESDGYIFIPGEFYDYSVDVRDPSNPKVGNKIELGNPVNADISGDLLISTNSYELQLIDISDPLNLTQISSFAKNTSGEAIRFIDSNTVITAADPGVWIVDVSDPANPKKISELTISGSVMDITLDGTTAYLSNLGEGVQIVDINDVSNPQLVGSISTLGLAYDCCVDGDLLIVADSYAGISIYQRNATASSESGAASEPVDLTMVYDDEPVSIYTPDTSSAPEETYEYIVTSAADSGAGTLREAIETAQSGTTITFDPAVFPADDPVTIQLASALPGIDQSYVTIDASNAGVILDGSALESGNGIQINNTHCTVMGLQVYNFPDTGFEVGGDYSCIGGSRDIGTGPVGQGNVASGNGLYGIHVGGWYSVVKGNLTGVDVTGTKAMPNSYGIFVSDWAFYVTVGGTKSGEGNVISGNDFINIDSWGDHTSIIGNLIGVDITGTKAVNTETACNVTMESGVLSNVVGGTTPEERNIISGAQSGFVFSDPNSYQCSVIGNYIGTDITGTKAIPNGSAGGPWTSSHHRIGGTAEGEGNLISGNLSGVTFSGYGVEDNLVLGNDIGLDAQGNETLPNDTGISICMGQIHAVIGGYTAAEGNTVYGGSISMRISDSGITDAFIAGNTVTSPNGNAIFLENGPSNCFVQGNTLKSTTNNAIRIDIGTDNLLRGNVFKGTNVSNFILLLTGGNEELSAPVVTSALGSEIAGTCAAYGLVEVCRYENGSTHSLGFTIANADGSFSYTSAESLTGSTVLLLVSDAEGNTSMFSALVNVG